MKKTLIAGLLALSTGIATVAFAASGDAEPRHERHMERMAKALELTAEQQEQLRGIHAEQREKHKALREESISRVDAVLTDEQRAKMAEQREKRQERMQERRSHRDGDRPRKHQHRS